VPITWNDDGWPALPADARPDAPLRKSPGENVGHGLPLSDDFASSKLGLPWRPSPDVAHVGDGKLTLDARGATLTDAARVSLTPVNQSFELTVEVELVGATEAGLLITGADGREPNTGVALRAGTVTSYIRGRGERSATPFTPKRAFLRIRNLDQDVALYFSSDGTTWTKFAWGSEVSGNGTLRVALYATGSGTAHFRHFTYHGL
jgi:xylan 1,4-beta-xylosidase